MSPRRLSVSDLDVRGKRVFVRVDFNVPLDKGVVGDDTRVRASLPTLQMLIERGARIVAASHLGRPKGEVKPDLSLRPVADRLRTLLRGQVRMAEDCVGPSVQEQARALRDGELLLLENLRFHAEEEKNDDGFAKQLSALADIYVNDAFGSAHRAHASVVGITRHLPAAAAGLLMERELEMLGRLRDRPEKPYVAVLGGAKVSDKLALINKLLPSVDAVLIGGSMGHTFIKARGTPVGSSRIEEDRMEDARSIIRHAVDAGVRLHLPIDHVVAPAPETGAPTQVTPGPDIPSGMMGLDIGPKTREAFHDEIRRARTIFWNGPLGKFEVAPFDAGTRAAAESIASTEAFSVVGGGDSVAAVNLLGLADRITHISTGGGASLEFLSGIDLPGVEALSTWRPDGARPGPGSAR